jgi:hypothetical protein
MWAPMIDGRTVHAFFELVDPWRRQRELDIEEALRSLDPEFPTYRKLHISREIDFALLHHTLYLAKVAAERSDERLASEALDVWRVEPSRVQPALISFKERQWLSLASVDCLLANFDRKFDSDAYAVTTKALTSPSPSADPGFIQTAFSLVDSTGLFFFIEVTCGVIINLQWRDLDDSMSGFTLSPFLGTVYTDWTDSELRYGESCVHESAHSWLNFLLAARSVEAPVTRNRWHSPWRGMPRPALGIVHGTFAFSIVFHFYDRLAEASGFDLLPEPQLAYCRDRRDYELKRLREVEPFLDEALNEIGNAEVTELVSSWYPGPKRFEIYRDG